MCISNQHSGRNWKVEKYSEQNCCTLYHASSFLSTLILKEVPPRQKSQPMQSYAVPSAVAEIQSRHGIVYPGSECTAIAHAEISRCNKKNGFNRLTQVHCDLQNILMKSISRQQFDFFHCPKTYQWACAVPFKMERILNIHLIDSRFLVSFKRLLLETGDESA